MRLFSEGAHAFDIVSAATQRVVPKLLLQLSPRRYEDTAGYESPVIGATYFASQLAAFAMETFVGTDMRQNVFTQMAAAAACELINHGTPRYYVSREIVEMVERLDSPPGARWTDLTLPYPAGIFMLPKGMFLDANGNAYNFITWCRVEAEKSILIPMTREEGSRARKMGFANNAIFFTTASRDDREFAGLTRNLAEKTWPFVTMNDYRQDGEILNLDENERGVIERLTSVCLNLLLLMETRPTVYREGKRRLPAPRKDPRETWEPRRIGYGAKIRYESTGSQGRPGEKHSPRADSWRPAHWTHQVRGHYRTGGDFVSIRDLPRDAAGAVDWANTPEDILDRFWKYHTHELRGVTFVSGDGSIAPGGNK